MNEKTIEEIAARLREATAERGKVRRLRLRQLQMWLKWAHNCRVSLSQLVRLVEEIADAFRGLQVTVKSKSTRPRQSLRDAVISFLQPSSARRSRRKSISI